MIPRRREEKFLHRGSVERVLHYRSIEDCANPLSGFKDYNESSKWEEKFLNCGSVKMVQHYRSNEDCADPLLGFKDHNDSSKIGGEVLTPWKCGKGPTPWKHRRLC